MAWRIMRGLIKSFADLIGTSARIKSSRVSPDAVAPRGMARESVDHVILLDGTMGSLHPARITSIGLIHHLLRGGEARASVYYGKGVEWREWAEVSEVILGWGVERQIRRAYGWLASHYREGDRIFILGYSRGAFAARSLAGIIDRVGLVRHEHAVERNIRLAWRYYERRDTPSELFHKKFCHPQAPIEMVGVFDTVRGLGLKLPIFWMFHDEARVLFHDHHLGPSVRHGFHALALDETRSVFEPLLWDSAHTEAGRIEQVWFRGSHGDIGGQLGDNDAARPLANIPLVWMLERMSRRGFALPAGWRALFPTDRDAPSLGTWRAWGKMFWLRAPRMVGNDPTEKLHETALGGRRWQAIISPKFARALETLPQTPPRIGPRLPRADGAAEEGDNDVALFEDGAFDEVSSAKRGDQEVPPVNGDALAEGKAGDMKSAPEKISRAHSILQSLRRSAS
ncbi:DUF2235 domain-containing protein [Albirhodobacter sp. R86504]|jgi:hypothetical protein|uniref:DUF2235 domain-containing protein n=1 Tax=Albirhodobacter sp. R86504 TaxID=3093848 RepID=UPI0036704616